MATLGANALTLADWAKRTDSTGRTMEIVELLSQTNDLIQDIPYVEANMVSSHKIATRTGLPAVFWRIINQGVQTSKSTTAQLIETTGILEAWSEIDTVEARLGGDVAGYRASESVAFTEAMNQEFAQTLIYGNSSVSPEEITGFAVRTSSLSAGNAANIIDAGGTGSDNTSIYLVGWGEQGIMGIFPKGSTAGLSHQDFGEVTVETTAGVAATRMRAYQEMWQWHTGIAMKNWQYLVRVANIDVSNMVADASAADLIRQMTKGMAQFPSFNLVKPIWYMNRSVALYLDLQTTTKVSAGGGLTWENVQGKPVPSFRGIPIRIVDQILNTEARVT